MDNIKTWWNGLVLREQQLVAACAIVLGVGILYWGIWTPISQAEADARRNLTAQESTLNYVKQTANKIAGLKQAGGKKGFSGSLSTVVTQSAKSYGLEITRMQPQGNKIQVWMDEVPFDSLLDYLSDLVQQKGLSLDNIDLADGEAEGFVKVRRIQFSQ
ncbi:type II secretion system protein M [Shewanella sp. Isolate8]|uniref:type II secretion system protein M n=1 Tax=Shewanella sp. Isolate8 TaxID=2908529 RepID=UPI001EFD86C4|nr:type II secretion system protein M [Shewanella sp. Isolate8]MCG9748376.1 type II secretion system protein M [Shewanella sp. Isolate8]